MAAAAYSARALPPLLFTENETNAQRLYGEDNSSTYVKDGIHDYIVQGRKEAVNPRSRRIEGCGALRGDGRVG